MIHNQRISILMDSGFTHNFMQTNVAKRLRLAMEPIPTFLVSTESGQNLTWNKMCKNVPVFIQGDLITIDLFLLKLEGANLVLSSQWMERLGDIPINLQDLSFAFVIDDKNIKWIGEPLLNMDLLSKGELKALSGVVIGFLC